MSNDKSVLTILTDTLAIMAERALAAESEQSAVKEDRDQWYGFYTAQKERADKLEEDLQATYKLLNEAEAHAAQMEAERNAARLVAERKRAELAALNEKGAEDHE